MILKNQRAEFSIPEDVHYINCAYMSPLLKASEEAGIKGIARKRNPGEVQAVHFFEEAERTRANFGKIINAKASEIALIPSCSYGLKSAITNVIPDEGQHAITISEEFPSGYFTLLEWSKTHSCPIRVLSEPNVTENRGKIWNEQLVNSIDKNTALVMLSSVHWTDGTKYNLKAIGEACKAAGAAFVVDGTQSVGAESIDVKALNIDALICSCYKWLLGPYSTAVGYYGEYFNNGVPIEDSWMNRSNAQDFSNLTDYDNVYTPDAGRYNVGEFSNFIALPMMNAGFDHILGWGIENIKQYCENLTQPLIDFLHNSGFWIEDKEYRSSHLFGFRVPDHLDKNELLRQLRENKVFLSLRNNSIRVSPHLFNTSEDIDLLISLLSK